VQDTCSSCVAIEDINITRCKFNHSLLATRLGLVKETFIGVRTLANSIEEPSWSLVSCEVVISHSNCDVTREF
jgi:3-phenylpropionate/cinnamic acid dioxygenase small subunit